MHKLASQKLIFLPKTEGVVALEVYLRSGAIPQWLCFGFCDFTFFSPLLSNHCALCFIALRKIFDIVLLTSESIFIFQPL